MKAQIKRGSTNYTLEVFIQDSSSSVGAGLTGLVYNSSGLVASYVRPAAARSALALVTQTVTGAHTDGGFVEIDSANMPGLYRLDLSDAPLATGVDHAVVMLKGATNMVPLSLEIQLIDLVVEADLSTDAEIADAIWDEAKSGHTTADSYGKLAQDVEVDTADMQPKLGTPASNVSADIAAVKAETALTVADTNELQTDNVPGLISALNNISTAQVNTEVDTALADVNLDHLVGTASGIPTIVPGTYIDQMQDDGTAVYDRTTDSLQAIADATGAAAPTTAQIATAVFETAMTEAYAVNGATCTLAQILYAVHQAIMQFGIIGTSKTVRKLDDVTTAFVVTHDDATSPTDAKRT